jgi:hypothetical protein
VAQRLRMLRFRSRVFRRPLVIYRHRGLDHRDAFIISYPRSGTTWLRFLLSEIFTGQPAEFSSVSHNVRYVGSHHDAPRILPEGGRLIFSHEKRALPRNKVVYATRDPRSVAISEYKWLLRRGLAPHSFDEFLVRFVKGKSNPWGSWTSHVDYWLGNRPCDALFLVRYEDLRADASGVAAQLDHFLGGTHDQATVERAVESNNLTSMRAKERRAPDEVFARGAQTDIRFVQQGEIKAWETTLSASQVRLIEEAFLSTMSRMGYQGDRDTESASPYLDSGPVEE